jgi:hypothetical protein
MRKKFFHYCLLNTMAILFLLLAGPEALAAGKAKSVIVLIVGGCSSEQYTFARWFKGSPLALDAIQVGAVKTYSVDSVLCDSASAACAYGPDKPQGLLDAPDIATVCARALGLNLARLNDRLFVDPEKAIPGAIVTVKKVDPNNPVVKIEYRGKWAELPVNKNILRMDSREIPLEGIVVYAPKTGMVYLPMQAVRLITGTSKPLPSVLR